MKPIRLSEHAKEQIAFRGAEEKQVIDAIKNSPWQPAETNRLNVKRISLMKKSGIRYIIKLNRSGQFL